MRRIATLKVVLIACATLTVASSVGAADTVSSELRVALLRRAHVWMPIDTASLDLRAGPQGAGSFAPDATVTCDYVDRSMSGHSPKFLCRANGEKLKVRYGVANGEAYASVAATRLLWALGFGADRVYPVQVICRHCPGDMRGGTPVGRDAIRFEIAAIERRAPGREIQTADTEGWAWPELDAIDAAAGGAPGAHLDALLLLAAFLQHTDNKPEQQRLVCLDDHQRAVKRTDDCRQPFMFIHDVGLTFGEAHWLNDDDVGSVNFVRWATTPIWLEGEGCVANLHPSLTGTLENPVISEAGRRFLAGLLARLSDRQLRDLFTVARFSRRGVADNGRVSNGSVEDWVAAFRKKRDEIAGRRCGDSAP